MSAMTRKQPQSAIRTFSQRRALHPNLSIFRLKEAQYPSDLKHSDQTYG